jgi:hypothetical protein
MEYLSKPLHVVTVVHDNSGSTGYMTLSHPPVMSAGCQFVNNKGELFIVEHYLNDKLAVVSGHKLFCTNPSFNH